MCCCGPWCDDHDVICHGGCPLSHTNNVAAEKKQTTRRAISCMKQLTRFEDSRLSANTGFRFLLLGSVPRASCRIARSGTRSLQQERHEPDNGRAEKHGKAGSSMTEPLKDSSHSAYTTPISVPHAAHVSSSVAPAASSLSLEHVPAFVRASWHACGISGAWHMATSARLRKKSRRSDIATRC